MTLYQKLRWLTRMGVDETISETAINRLKKQEKNTISVLPTQQNNMPAKPSTPIDTTVQMAVMVAESATDVTSLSNLLSTFDAATLKKTAANTVFARGTTSAPLMIIGDMPEASDDLAGLPFTGESGELLTKMMAGIGLNIETDCYLTTLIPWRAPGGRKPTAAETAYCLPFLKRHIELVKPRFILLFGASTCGALLGIDSLSRARGTFHAYQSEKLSAPIMMTATFSPAYLLKNQTHKKYAWEDLKRLKAKMSESEDESKNDSWK